MYSLMISECYLFQIFPPFPLEIVRGLDFWEVMTVQKVLLFLLQAQFDKIAWISGKDGGFKNNS